jgi:hypothetical protein
VDGHRVLRIVRGGVPGHCDTGATASRVGAAALSLGLTSGVMGIGRWALATTNPRRSRMTGHPSLIGRPGATAQLAPLCSWAITDPRPESGSPSALRARVVRRRATWTHGPDCRLRRGRQESDRPAIAGPRSGRCGSDQHLLRPLALEQRRPSRHRRHPAPVLVPRRIGLRERAGPTPSGRDRNGVGAPPGRSTPRRSFR